VKHYSTGKSTADLGELMVTAARVGGGEPTVGGARGEGLKDLRRRPTEGRRRTNNMGGGRQR
jgi:hypothetical protein